MLSVKVNKFGITRRMALVAVACSAIFVGGCSSIMEAVYGGSEWIVKDDKLFLSGVIDSASPDEFEEIMSKNPGITTLVETKIEGSIDDEAMIELGYRVRELGLNTHLLADSEIYSGGVDLFLAGVKRTSEPGAIIGVHSWSDGDRDGAEYPKDSSEHHMNLRYIERMLGDGAFYWFTLAAAPAEGIHIMTKAEINRYGLLTH